MRGFCLLCLIIAIKVVMPVALHPETLEWQKEFYLGRSFAKSHDLDNSITSFKRALFLLPESELENRMHIEYATILSYFLSQRFDDVVSTFENSSLVSIDLNSPLYKDLSLILFESYEQLNQKDKAGFALNQLKRVDLALASKLELTSALYQKDVNQLEAFAHTHQSKNYILDLLSKYKLEKKSPKMAKVLNFICPGAGYLYVGQKRAALTSFLINSFLVTASVQLIMKRYYPLAILTLGFECGWYFGGAFGAERSAIEYNKALFEAHSKKILFQEEAIPHTYLDHVF